MVISKNIIFIIIVFFISIQELKIVSSLSQEEYKCFDRLAIKTNNTNEYPLNSNNLYDFCLTNSLDYKVTCVLVQGVSVVDKINITSKSFIDYSLDTSDFSCFPKLTYLLLKNFPIPNFSNFKIATLTMLFLQTPPSYISWSNFSTFTQISTVNITSEIPIQFPNDLCLNKSSILRVLNVNSGYFIPPTSLIDINCPAMFSLLINFPGKKSFNLNGLFPFSDVPHYLAKNQFYIDEGNYTDVPPLDLFSTYKHVVFSNSGIKGQLPTFDYVKNKGMLILDLSGNQITGSVDESICALIIDVSGNLLTGTIPSCFTCWFSNTTIYSNFAGNSFTNYQINLPCTTITANLRNYKYQPKNQIALYGNDLGFNGNTITSNPTITWSVVTPSFEFVAYSDYVGIIDFMINGQQFTLTNDPKPPQIHNITFTNQGMLTIYGSQFSPNKANVSVVIQGKDCILNTTTFYKIECTMSNNIVVDTENGTIINLASWIKVDDLVSPLFQVYEDPQGTTVIKYHSCGEDINCGENSFCNIITGQCTLLQYISSVVVPNSIDGGTVLLYGYYGELNLNLKVTIGQDICIINSISNNLINCTIGKGIGTKDIKVSQNNLYWVGKNYFNYYIPTKTCPNSCTSIENGLCNLENGVCNCKSPYIGLDCSSKNDTKEESKTIVLENGNTIISNQDTNYKILVTDLIEVNFNGELIERHELENKWELSINESTDYIHVFKQTLSKADGLNSSISCIIEEIQVSKNHTFAGESIILEANSIKISILIDNYKFKASLNTLQLYFKTDIGNPTNSNQYDNSCNENGQNITVGDNTDLFYEYVKLYKNGKILYGRFLKNILSDDRPTLVSTSIISKDNGSIIVALNLPHCSKCLIDPDFSVLVSNNFISSCGSSSNDRKWVIPVAVVVSVAGAAIIFVSIFLLIKKNTSIKIKIFKLKKLKNKN